MKLLFGVQATGNGHITRARALAAQLKKLSVDVDFLFSGRKPTSLFDMQVFGDYSVAKGLTFYSHRGRIKLADTLLRNNIVRLAHDARRIDVDAYDLVVTDYEPVTAWSARLAAKPLVGIGHQYAFNYDIPKCAGRYLDRFIMKNFAPAQHAVGLHWHHFNQPILPPIAPIDVSAYCPKTRQYLVYLPFESSDDITALLKPFNQFSFVVYHVDKPKAALSHIRWQRPGLESFKHDLLSSEGVICNAGFELPSEALQLGMKLLVKPMALQPEQQSNALAIEHLAYGYIMKKLQADRVADFLEKDGAVTVQYPDTASAVAQWLANGAQQPIADLSNRLWSATQVIRRGDLNHSTNIYVKEPIVWPKSA